MHSAAWRILLRLRVIASCNKSVCSSHLLCHVSSDLVKRPQGFRILEQRLCLYVMGRLCEVMARFISLRAVLQWDPHSGFLNCDVHFSVHMQQTGTSQVSESAPHLYFFLSVYNYRLLCENWAHKYVCQQQSQVFLFFGFCLIWFVFLNLIKTSDLTTHSH